MKALLFTVVIAVTGAFSGENLDESYLAPSSGKRFGGAIVPWSQYRKKLEVEKQKSMEIRPDEDPDRPVTIYLPPSPSLLSNYTALHRQQFASSKAVGISGNKRVNQSIDHHDASSLERSTKMVLPPPVNSVPVHGVQSIPGDQSINPRPNKYSTNAHREIITTHEKLMPAALSRPQPQVQIVPTNIRDSVVAQPSFSLAQKPPVPISNGVSTLTANHAGALLQNTGNPQNFQNFGVPNFFGVHPPQPAGIQPENFVNSIFSQSQVRSAGLPATGGLGSDLFGNAITPINGQPPANPLGNFNPLQLLSTARDSPVEQIARIAKNLLSHENQELFSAVSNVLGGKATKPLTSTALTDAAFKADSIVKPETAAAEAAELIASSKDHKDQINSILAKDGSDSELANMLNALPLEERKLLEAAIKNGELDASSLSTLDPKNVTEAPKPQNETKPPVQTERKLVEWIQQNRKKPANHTETITKPVIKEDWLPYYGRYCGSFAEKIDPTKSYGINGALWVVDNKRLVVSKFHFQPAFINDNVTFWGGPKKHSSESAKHNIPDDNGFYLKPVPLEIDTFALKEIRIVKASIRHTVARNTTLAETENNVLSSKNTTREKRDVFSNYYEEKKTFPFKIRATFGEDEDKLAEILDQASFNATELDSWSDANWTSTNSPSLSPTTNTVTTITTSPLPSTTAALPSTLPPSGNRGVEFPISTDIQPLEWYAGFQPLLLTLPDDQFVKTTHWISIYDHKRKTPVAFVLIPTGPGFYIPSIVQLRPFSSFGTHKVKSGPIHIKDTKTIEVTEFTLETDGVPVWFMVGKEVLPNGNGHIVPIYDTKSREFDCMSLRDYNNETVTIRLPGNLNIRDVFWFSVFSIPQSVSLTHMYLPYNDMHLPPDLENVVTPVCEWTN